MSIETKYNAIDLRGEVDKRRRNKSRQNSNWFTAMADAWGKTLDNQANNLETLSNEIGNQGKDTPSKVTELSAESLRMQFLSQSSHTSLSSLGSALETMARKQ